MPEANFILAQVIMNTFLSSNFLFQFCYADTLIVKCSILIFFVLLLPLQRAYNTFFLVSLLVGHVLASASGMYVYVRLSLNSYSPFKCEQFNEENVVKPHRWIVAAIAVTVAVDSQRQSVEPTTKLYGMNQVQCRTTISK